jgi:cysteinyl-tRNA synthetase
VPIPFRLYGIYVCGMTVYDHAHVGHARAMVVFDAFVRWLRANGWSCASYATSPTSTTRSSAAPTRRASSPMVIAQRYIDAFRATARASACCRPTWSRG